MPKASEYVLATDFEVRAARATGNRTDFRIRGAPNLQLRVTAAGTKSWAVAYKSPATGRWSKAALGRYPDLGLAQAKSMALELTATVRSGRDPVHDKREEAVAETFGALAMRYMVEHERRNARGGKPSTSTLENQRQLKSDILPRLGRIKAGSVTRQQVMSVVEAVADRGAYVAADRALGLIRAIYNWGCATGRLEHNPTIGLKKRNTSRPKVRVLSADEIRIFWHLIDTPIGISHTLRDAYRLQLLTGVRAGEVLGAAQRELDLDRRLWTIPAIRTKADREHALPLSPPAVEIFRHAIERAQEVSKTTAWVFPSPRTGGPIAAHAASTGILRMRAILADAGIDTNFNTHDLRRTVATHLGEMRVADELIERILNHAPRTIAGKHYNHARYLEPMRQALDDWAARLGMIVDAALTADAVKSSTERAA